MRTIKKYFVIDDDGKPIRWFYSKEEAEQFACNREIQVRVMPKIDITEFEPAPF